MAYTGGELNQLNGKYGISAPNKSVPIMKLIKAHKPKSHDELLSLIEYHFKNDCDCKIKSTGTISDFGRNLYEAQMQEWGRYKYTLEQCIQWEYDLFIVQSWKGDKIEKEAIKLLSKSLPELEFVEASGYLDEELRVDIEIIKGDKSIAGIQVKPATYKLMRPGIKIFNKSANQLWGKPVYYLFYDEDNKFENISEIVEILKKL